MAALRPAHAADEPRLAQGRQQLVQIRLRDALASRDLGALSRPLPVLVGKFDEGADAVVALRGDTHFVSSSGLSVKLSDYINNITGGQGVCKGWRSEADRLGVTAAALDAAIQPESEALPSKVSSTRPAPLEVEESTA
jgi:hypothetical protein